MLWYSKMLYFNSITTYPLPCAHIHNLWIHQMFGVVETLCMILPPRCHQSAARKVKRVSEHGSSGLSYGSASPIVQRGCQN